MNNINRFKFRIWDNSHDKRWITGTCEYLHDEKIFDLQKSTNTDDDSWVIQQYTGVNDKEGNEIFEGDIIQWDAGWFYKDEKQLKGFIIFEDCSYYCKFKNDTIGKWGLSKRCVPHETKIIGNIFENPELLIIKD